MSKNNEKDKEDGNYDFPELKQEIPCPICKEGVIKINRTVHTLPDGEDILILLMQCDSCNYQSRDVISLRSAFKPGIWTLKIMDGDLSHKIFRGPEGIIHLPEADFEIEPGTQSGYMVTTVEGILERMIKWTGYLIKTYKENPGQYHDELEKAVDTLNKLNLCKQGRLTFSLMIEDKAGGSYISCFEEKDADLSFEEFPDSE